MAYEYIEYPDNELLSDGELLVINEAKGIWQIVPNVQRPYNLVYLPENNNVYASRDLMEFEGLEFQHIKVVK